MTSTRLEHRLAAVLSAEGAGYTRLLAEDADTTIRALAEARSEISACVSRHRGRVVDATGDNLLAEFPSAVDAVRCGVEVQRRLGEIGAPVPAPRRLLFRLGLHLGDVAVEDGRIYGDGINVAARLQALAEPGGICVSGAIHDNVRSNLDLPFRDLGEQTLKNFPRPVRVFRLGGSVSGAAPAPPPEPPAQPSLVVLPFANVSGDSEQEYFADGMSEDLISELARVPGLFVIGRSTSFSYKGKSIAARELGHELGVKHLVEGSVRRAGARVRISARLTDAQSGRELWSERWDRELGDVFALQDEVVAGVVAGLRRALGTEIEHTPRGRPVRSDVWSLLVQGRAQLDRNLPEAVRPGRELLRRCVEADPDLALGWAELSRVEFMLGFFGEKDEPHLEQGIVHAQRAIALDPQEPTARITLGWLLAMKGDFASALAAARPALELAPGDPEVLAGYAALLNFADRHEEAIPLLKSASRADPATRYMHLFQLAIAYRGTGRDDEAIAKHRECTAANPGFWGANMNLVALYTMLGETHHARAELAELYRVRPGFTLRDVPRLPTGREFLLENLRKAGVPE